MLTLTRNLLLMKYPYYNGITPSEVQLINLIHEWMLKQDKSEIKILLPHKSQELTITLKERESKDSDTGFTANTIFIDDYLCPKK